MKGSLHINRVGQLVFLDPYPDFDEIEIDAVREYYLGHPVLAFINSWSGIRIYRTQYKLHE